MSSEGAVLVGFSVGDYAFFARRFTPADWRSFSELSGDLNPLHHDQAYAASTEYGHPIVPLHLAAAPLSMIAGMMIPGEPSLYLSHDLRVLKPIYYGDDLIYSARVKNVSVGMSALTLSVIAFRRSEVVLQGTMNVGVRGIGAAAGHAGVHRASEARWALVTGATGAIGSAVALALARAGWNLLLQYRGDEEAVGRLVERCTKAGFQAEAVRADLESPGGRRDLVHRVASGSPPLSTVVHTASPRVNANVDELAQVNYAALRELSDAAVPFMLRRQDGAIVLIGSSAMTQFPDGWENYTAAKSMAVSLVSGLSQRYGSYGVRGITVAPGYVRTRFSEKLQPANAAALLPEEVAEIVVDAITSGDSTYVAVEPGSLRRGRFGFHPASGLPRGEPIASAAATEPPAASPKAPAVAEGTSKNLETVFRRVIKRTDGVDVRTAEVGVTPGWDSLSHIELILEIEREFGISFTSQEMNQTHRYEEIEALWRRKMGQ